MRLVLLGPGGRQRHAGTHRHFAALKCRLHTDRLQLPAGLVCLPIKASRGATARTRGRLDLIRRWFEEPNSLPHAQRSSPTSREFHLRLKRIGTVRSTRLPGNSRGGGGKGCARRNSASASSSSALAPDERTTRLPITRPCRSRLKKTWATPCSRRD